tara:strand:+ start:1013 stop:2245 length:1233 start_codon:yes stop_codon:yes gene_type:complete
MKVLGLVNLILILMAYFFVEKDAVEKLKKTRLNSYLFSDEVIIRLNDIKLARAKLLKVDNWSLANYPSFNLDQEKIEKFLKQLQNIKIEKRLPDDFKFKGLCELSLGDKLTLNIGNKTNYSENFYIQLNNESFLVRDLTPQTKPLPKEVYRLNPYKHLRLLSFCESRNFDLVSKLIFKNYKIEHLGFDYFTGSSFKLNFSNFSGEPLPFNNHRFSQYAMSEFRKQLLSVKVDRYFKDKPFDSGTRVLTLSVNEKMIFEIYRSGKNNYIYSKDQSIWGELANSIFANTFYQDFWETNILTRAKTRICVHYRESKSSCFSYKSGVISDSDTIYLDFNNLYKTLDAISKNALLVKKIDNDKKFEFPYDFILEFNFNKFLVKKAKRIITVIDFQNNFQYEYLIKQDSPKVSALN